MMKAQLRKFILETAQTAREEEISAILDIFEERVYPKGSYFKESGTCSQELGFMVTGSARSYIVKDDGREITGMLNEENSFLVDMISARTKEPNSTVIEFLERSTMLVTPVTTMRAMLNHNLTLNILIREYISERAVDMGKRQLLFLTGTAKERYQFILENNPGLLKKFPLRFVATLIGITPTQLSRIRKQKQ